MWLTEQKLRSWLAQITDVLGINSQRLTDCAGIELEEQGAAPSTAIKTGAIYSKDVAGSTHLFYRQESDGAEHQLTPAAGGGDVTGPAGATDNAVARYDGATGKLLQDSLVTVSDAGSVSVPAGQTVDGRDVSVDGTKLDGVESGADVTDETNVLAALATSAAAKALGGGSITNVNLVDGRDVSVDGAAIDARLPSTDQKAALAGTAGSPSGTNEYVTDVDPRVDWVTALDLDFSAQANQTLSPDGNYVVGGYTWTKENSAADNVAMAVVNGSGLVIRPVAASNYIAGTRTAPILRIDLSSLISGYLWSYALRGWIYVSACNDNANFDFFTLAFETGTGASTASSMQAGRIRNSGQKLRNYLTYLTTNVTQFSSTNASADVRVLEAQDGVLSSDFRCWTGTYAAGWPAVTALIPGLRPANAGNFNLVGVAAAPTNGNLVLTAGRVSSATALSVTIARVRVDYRVR
jgi:hypothetical protein